jgi:hypothetical protein
MRSQQNRLSPSWGYAKDVARKDPTLALTARIGRKFRAFSVGLERCGAKDKFRLVHVAGLRAKWLD